MRKKGAELPDNLLSIIIAVIVILAFAVGAYKLFTIYSNQESKNAQNTLDVIKGKIDALQDGQTNSFLVQGFQNGQNWVIVGWNKGDALAPDKCNYQSCICVCPAITSNLIPSGSRHDSLIEQCQGSNGFCRQLDFSSLKINTITSPRADPEFTYIYICDSVQELTITKLKDQLIIYSDKQCTKK